MIEDAVDDDEDADASESFLDIFAHNTPTRYVHTCTHITQEGQFDEQLSHKTIIVVAQVVTGVLDRHLRADCSVA